MSRDLRRIPMTWAAITAITVIVLTVLAATATVLIGRQLNGLEAERQASTAAADTLARVAEDVRTTISSATAEASAGTRATDVNADFPADVAKSTAIRARDSAQPVLDDSGEGVVVVASYDTAVPPATVQERRDHVAGYVVVPLNLGATLQPLKPSEGGIAVAGPNRQVMSIPDTRPSDAAFQTVELGSGTALGWTLTVWTAPTHTPAVVWLIVLVLVLGLTGSAAAGWMVVRRERARRSRDDLLRLQESSATVAALATVAQHSLDLAEVLPAVSAELGDRHWARPLHLPPHRDRPRGPHLGGEPPRRTDAVRRGTSRHRTGRAVG